MKKATKKNCFASKIPDLINEWHPTKNGKLTPWNVTYGSKIVIWWICLAKHSWAATPNNRYRGTKCPYCSGLFVIDTNRLSILNPELAKEWHPTKNGKLVPHDVSIGSHQKPWWICPKKHEWQATINMRHGQDTGCPYCSGQKFCKDNSLFKLNPKLSLEWDYIKNKNLTPHDIGINSAKKVWWKCPIDSQSWLSTTANRIHGNGCPYCANKKVYIDNCLATVNSKLAEEWHPEKNGKLMPNNVVAGSKIKYWWICNKNKKHEWQATIYSRNVSNNGCPYCAHQKICLDNCLATVNSKLAAEWNTYRNGGLTAFDVICGGKEKRWWICSVGHEWRATGYDRNRGSGCPYCDGITLKNDVCCDSIPEAYMYLIYEQKSEKFIHHGHYDGKLKRKIYDFYFPKENKYVEITSYTENYKYWKKYHANILKKKNYVEKVLNAKFEFIQFTPTKKQIEFVRKHSK